MIIILIMNLDYTNYEKINKNLNNYLFERKVINKDLQNRGEAHITVISPPEYDNILKGYITIDEINHIAQMHDIQSAKFKIVGIGMGEANLDTGRDTSDKTFYIIVKSKDLIKIRKAIFRVYKNNGGIPSRFDYNNYRPHITLGFTKRDLFEEDGVLKGKNSYYLPLEKIHM